MQQLHQRGAISATHALRASAPKEDSDDGEQPQCLYKGAERPGEHCRGQADAKEPTIAIIVGQYYEKTAVDAMMTNRQTFVRYATNGETQAYTIGDIGEHRCVVTKLPLTGHSREAAIASGSSTTRLLGTFQGVEHVFIVGVGGGVPHYTDC